jgi:hypothetical protein
VGRGVLNGKERFWGVLNRNAKKLHCVAKDYNMSNNLVESKCCFATWISYESCQ